eukprot:COSAG01_NODE_2041_length_8568_cov_5.033180_11_plen_66_part_00
MEKKVQELGIKTRADWNNNNLQKTELLSDEMEDLSHIYCASCDRSDHPTPPSPLTTPPLPLSLTH